MAKSGRTTPACRRMALTSPRAPCPRGCQNGLGKRTRSAALPLPLFVALSLALHAAAYRAALRAGEAPHPQAFAPSSQGLTGETLDVEPASAAPDESDE